MAILSRDGYERRRWRKALRLLGRGLPVHHVVAATGVKRSTLYYRLARERELLSFMATD